MQTPTKAAVNATQPDSITLSKNSVWVEYGNGASYTWRYAPESVCGPNGDYGSNVNVSTLITEKAPIGALIGKIGGSTASKDDGLLVFCVGSFCVLRLSDAQQGPLFLTINDSPRGFQDNDGEMIVNVFEGI